MFANTEGTWLWSAQLNDDRNLAEIELAHEQAKRDPHAGRPSLAGYDATRAEIRDLRNDIRAIHRLPTVPGPQGPIERIKARKRDISLGRVHDLLNGR